jgi:RHS repeat-associated protein
MHGQVFDFDTGLLYCRSRYYDPYSAAFLQRDPEGYADSVNQYAAFAHNPVNMTDRSGTVAADYADSVRKFGERAADRYGFPGRIVNTISKGVGWLLELGTEASQGWDLLQSDRQGSFGLIDRMQGAQMLVDEGNKILMAGMLLHAAGGMIASKAEGYLSAAAHREIDGARRASRELFAYHEESRSYSQAISDLKRMGGFHEIESEAAIYASENTGVAAHARYNEKKAQVRYARVSEGFEGKPGYLGVKVDEGTGIAEHTVTGGSVRYGVDNETGKNRRNSEVLQDSAVYFGHRLLCFHQGRSARHGEGSRQLG